MSRREFRLGEQYDEVEPLPISTVYIAAWGEGGKPMPSVESAVCDICGMWATSLCVTSSAKSDGSFLDLRVSRRTTVCVYACTAHRDQVMGSLVDEYGSASNRYDRDDLAYEVDRRSRPGF